MSLGLHGIVQVQYDWRFIPDFATIVMLLVKLTEKSGTF